VESVEEAPSSFRSWLLIMLLLLVVAAGAGFYLMQPEQKPVTPAEAEEPAIPPIGSSVAAAPPASQQPAAAAPEPRPRYSPVSPTVPSPATAAVVPAMPLSSGGLPLEEIIERASAGVVSIETTATRGTGFFVTPDLIVTNAHVVGGHSYLSVRLAGGKTIQGRVERTSVDLDLATIRASAPREATQILELGSLSNVRAGQEVLAIGSPLGLQNTVTRGIVSAVRMVGGVQLIQTDAAINPGNSGGPLLDRDGRVIGITTLKMARGAESLGFAVGVGHAVPLIEGRAMATGMGTPQAPSLPAVIGGSSPSTASPGNADTQRDQGQMVFQKTMEALAQRADLADAQWAKFQANCLVNPLPSDGQRPWFVVRDTLPTFKTGDRWCINFLDELRGYIAQWSQAMAQAGDAARRAGVYPGTMRDTRRKYRLDWSGWDR